MKLNNIHIEKLSAKAGQDVTTPWGATILQLDIETATGQRLSINTVKRLVGVITSNVKKPRSYTLKIISDYLGYPDWRLFCRTCFSD